ncbi:MAG: tRNA (guanosine(46)-N7)-methyltransferase TrmB [Phycisphaerae bacterium]|nr:tRNA (guanosine(46)-N7)-methyltransferase TrmB [Phycisphaerae bacterium]
MLGIENIIVAAPGRGEKISFRTLFGDDHPVEMEIGTGKGGFLLRRAQAHPDRRFFGIEWANKICRYVADRMVRHGVTNVRLMRTDARHLVMYQMPPECVTIIHIYHPDPWPKKRHHKRRLIQPALLAAVVEILVPGGRVAIQTDHAEYFEQIRAVARGEPRLEEVAFDVPEAGVVEGRVQTNFEIKYLREGRTLYQMALRKRARSATSSEGSSHLLVRGTVAPAPDSKSM